MYLNWLFFPLQSTTLLQQMLRMSHFAYTAAAVAENAKPLQKWRQLHEEMTLNKLMPSSTPSTVDKRKRPRCKEVQKKLSIRA